MSAHPVEPRPSHPKFWDPYSDQPYPIARGEKRRYTPAALGEYLVTALTALLVSPALLFRYLKPRRQAVSPAARDFVGLSVSPGSGYDDQVEAMVAELGVRRLLVRMPSWDVDRIDDYVRFVERFAGRDILVNVLQHRQDVLQPARWRHGLETIFDRFGHLAGEFQIGNAINRTKWGCMHSGEYLRLLEIAEEVRSGHPGIRLAGSSAIDFEPLVTLRTLVNRRRYRLDAVSAALYVNRRGAPTGRQYGIFDLERKLRLIGAIVSLAKRARPRLWITEVNWPLLDTRPYTPNSGRPETTVDERTQAHYLEDYYRIAWRSGLVERVYWWQLIAPGYGLVDSRGGVLRKRPSYAAFAYLLDGGLEAPIGAGLH
jgi:hypothetical protein